VSPNLAGGSGRRTKCNPQELTLAFKPWAVREIKDFSERTVLLASGQPVSESAAVPVMPSELTVCCGEGRSMLSV
jgi:hypothetical protein